MSQTVTTGYRSHLIFTSPYAWESSERPLTTSIDDTAKAYGRYVNAQYVKESLLELCNDNNGGEPVNRVPSIYSLMRLLIALDKLPLEENDLNKFVNELAKHVEGYKEVLCRESDNNLDIDLEL